MSYSEARTERDKIKLIDLHTVHTRMLERKEKKKKKQKLMCVSYTTQRA
jgi:hypothetical protein